MNTTDTISGIPADVKAELQQTLDDLVKGIRRPDKMKAACDRMDRMREENRLSASLADSSSTGDTQPPEMQAVFRQGVDACPL